MVCFDAPCTALFLFFSQDLNLIRNDRDVAHYAYCYALKPILLKTKMVLKIIHSFCRLIYRLLKRLLLRGAPSPVMDKEEGLQKDVKLGKLGHQTGDHSMLMDPQLKTLILLFIKTRWEIIPC